MEEKKSERVSNVYVVKHVTKERKEFVARFETKEEAQNFVNEQYNYYGKRKNCWEISTETILIQSLGKISTQTNKEKEERDE